MFTKKKEGETTSAFLYRFSKKMQQSGILREARKRRFHDRKATRAKRRLSAIYRDGKKKEMMKNRKMGLL